MVPKSPLANFGSVRGVAGRGITRGVQGAAGVKNVEMHVGPRPVKGGPGLMGVNIRPLTKPHGGSRGPVDPWSAAAASKRRDLWFFRSRKNDDNSRSCQKEGRKVILATNLQDKLR